MGLGRGGLERAGKREKKGTLQIKKNIVKYSLEKPVWSRHDTEAYYGKL